MLWTVEPLHLGLCLKQASLTLGWICICSTREIRPEGGGTDIYKAWISVQETPERLSWLLRDFISTP